MYRVLSKCVEIRHGDGIVRICCSIGEQCGANGENPGSSQCISIAKCGKGIRSRRGLLAWFCGFNSKDRGRTSSRQGRYVLTPAEIFGNVNAVGFLLKPELASVNKCEYWGIWGGGGGGG